MTNPETDEFGSRFWYNDDEQLHRTDGPAAEYASGCKAWHHNGLLHRTDGPAYEYASGAKLYYLHGKEVPPFEVTP